MSGEARRFGEEAADGNDHQKNKNSRVPQQVSSALEGFLGERLWFVGVASIEGHQGPDKEHDAAEVVEGGEPGGVHGGEDISDGLRRSELEEVHRGGEEELDKSPAHQKVHDGGVGEALSEDLALGHPEKEGLEELSQRREVSGVLFTDLNCGELAEVEGEVGDGGEGEEVEDPRDGVGRGAAGVCRGKELSREG